MNNDDDHPLLQTFSRVANVLILVAIPVAFIFMIWSMPYWWRARAKSRDNVERTYWNLRILGLTAAIYCMAMVGILFIFCIFTNYPVFEHWPTMSSLLGWGGNDQDVKVAYDVCICIVIFIGTCIVAPIYGTHDIVDMIYTAPDWHCVNTHIEDVDARLRDAMAEQPSTNPKYAHLTPIEKKFLDANWQERYDDALRRYKDVHEMYGK